MEQIQPPKVLTDVGLSVFVNTVNLRELPFPILNISLERLVWHFDMPVWEKDGTDDWNLTPWEVIKREAGTSEHQKRVEEADTTYPILVTEYKSRIVIIDGIHRLVKSYVQNQKTISAKIIPSEYLTLRDYQR